MFMNPVSNQYCDKLCNPCKQQIGVQSLFIPGLASGNTKAVLEMVNGLFNCYSDLVGGIPFLRATDSAGVGTQVFLRINIKHPVTGRTGTRVFTMADTFASAGFLVICPLHFGAYKLHGRKTAAQMGPAPFPFHWEEGSFGQQGTPV